MAHPVAVRLVTFTVGFGMVWLLLAGTGTAATVNPRPCSTGPVAPVPVWDGDFSLSENRPGKKMLRRSGVKQRLAGAAGRRLGDPAFPVRRAKLGAASKVWLKGGINFRRGKRLVKVRNLVVTVPKKAKRPARVTARIGKRQVVLYRINGGKRKVRAARGELDLLRGNVRFGAGAVKEINLRLGLKKREPAKRLRAGVKLGRTWLSVTWSGEASDDPMGEAPPEAEVLTKPEAGVTELAAAPEGGVSIRWEMRDTWVNYINGLEKPKYGDGATAGPEDGDGHVHEYNFKFDSGWTVTDPAEAGVQPGEVDTFIQGEGAVGFRHCAHGINFTAADPEIELGGNTNSQMIFRVNGIENTPYPDQRAVMIKLLPDAVQGLGYGERGAPAKSESEHEGITTVEWTNIPGFIPAEGTGIFADFYPAYNPDYVNQGYDLKDRPDRFGFLDVTYTYPTDGSNGEDP